MSCFKWKETERIRGCFKRSQGSVGNAPVKGAVSNALAGFATLIFSYWDLKIEFFAVKTSMKGLILKVLERTSQSCNASSFASPQPLIMLRPVETMITLRVVLNDNQTLPTFTCSKKKTLIALLISSFRHATKCHGTWKTSRRQSETSLSTPGDPSTLPPMPPSPSYCRHRRHRLHYQQSLRLCQHLPRHHLQRRRRHLRLVRCPRQPRYARRTS